MTDKRPGVIARRPISRWLQIVIGVLAIGAVVFVVGIAWGLRNTARSAADWIPAFADSTGAIAYCANGAARGIDNQIPWWEWTLLADGAPDDYAEELSAVLEANGFGVTVSQGAPVEYGANSTLNNPQYLESIGWATSWVRLDASNAAGISVLARVADGNTRNNCFPESGDVVRQGDPSEADVVAVILFRDTIGR